MMSFHFKNSQTKTTADDRIITLWYFHHKFQPPLPLQTRLPKSSLIYIRWQKICTTPFLMFQYIAAFFRILCSNRFCIHSHFPTFLVDDYLDGFQIARFSAEKSLWNLCPHCHPQETRPLQSQRSVPSFLLMTKQLTVQCWRKYLKKWTNFSKE